MRPALTGQAYLLTGDLAEAHDLAQETLCRAWRQWDRLQTYEQPAAWARKVLSNLVIGRWRKNARGRRLIRPDGTDRSSDAIEQLASHLDVLQALKSLPQKQRQAIVLRDFAGLSVTELAVEMSVPVGTVKSWLSRGHAAVAARLELGDVLEGGGH
jgi:RNA polymerase sigma-70 factor, ECF subfamily